MIDLIWLVKVAGYLGLFGIIFAESGFFLGFFLPGDSLLFTAGFLASQSYLNIWCLVLVVFVAAVLGDNFGYWFGRKVGPLIFRWPDSFLFKQDNVTKARDFFARYGGKSLILARFIPVVRTFTPIVAGVGEMSYARFFGYNLLGGFLWTAGVTLAGYYLGQTVPNADQYIVLIVFVIIGLSLLPVAWELSRHHFRCQAK
jgi:membrane-associated protein